MAKLYSRADYAARLNRDCFFLLSYCNILVFFFFTSPKEISGDFVQLECDLLLS